MTRVVLGKVSERPGDASTSTGSGAGDALVFLDSVTATGASVVSSGSFASVASSYVAIHVFANGIRTATASIIGIRTSSDGTNYAATAGAYTRAGTYNTATQATAQTLTSTTTDMWLITDTAAISSLATSAGAALSARITLYNLNATATLAFPESSFRAVWQGSNEIVGGFGFGKRTEAIAQGGVQLVNRGGGNFIDGRIDVYGVKGSA